MTFLSSTGDSLPGATDVRSTASVRQGLMVIAAFAAFHVALALVLRPVPLIAVLHALTCLGIGLIVAARRPLHEVAVVVAYIAGAEVLWRMTRTPVPWEYSKYAVSLILIVALLRIRPVRNCVTALGYFALLLPSALLTVLAFELGQARELLSFNLSGPLALMLCILFFSNIQLTVEQVRRPLLVLMGPAIGIAAVAYFRLSEIEKLEFTANSNPALSGGYGPNQVSAILGLGLLGCLLLLLERKQPLYLRVTLIAGAVVFAVQAALTFSRGGIVLALVSIIAAAMYLVREGRTRATLLIVAALLFGIARLFVVPRLDAFTSGKLTERYTDTDTTGRTLLASYDLQIFADNPLLGVGPGAAAQIRGELGHFGAAHTEFTRMLAEHGLLGAVAIIFLVVLGLRTLREARTVKSRAFVVALLAWASLFLVINAMRLVAPAFVAGLACTIAYASQSRVKAL